MKILPAFLVDHMTLLPEDHSFPTFPKLRGGFANVNKLIGDYHVDCLIIIILLLSNTIIKVRIFSGFFLTTPKLLCWGRQRLAVECGVDQESRGEYLDTGCLEILDLTLAAKQHKDDTVGWLSPCLAFVDNRKDRKGLSSGW